MGAELVIARLGFPKWTLYLEILKKGLTRGRGKEQRERSQFCFNLVGSFCYFFFFIRYMEKAPNRKERFTLKGKAEDTSHFC